MFQAKNITLSGKDRSKGERLAISSGGGVYFDSAPNGLFVSFDDSPIQLPVKSGRSYDTRFSSLTLWHALGYGGDLAVILYEKGEGIFDSSSAGGGSGGGSAASSSRVIVMFPWQNGAAVHQINYLYNPAGSGAVYTVRRFKTFQTVVTNAMDDAIAIGDAAAAPGAAGDGTWGVAPRDAKSVSYADTSRGGINPKLQTRFVQQAGRTANTTRRIIGRNIQQENEYFWLEGFVIRPATFLAMESIASAMDGYLYAELDEETVAS